MPFDIPFEDSYWENAREAYDNGDPWCCFEDEEEDDIDFLYDQYVDDMLTEE